MNRKLIEMIREEFEKIISRKNGWGKNEIMAAHNEAVTRATLRLLDGDTGQHL